MVLWAGSSKGNLKKYEKKKMETKKSILYILKSLIYFTKQDLNNLSLKARANQYKNNIFYKVKE